MTDTGAERRVRRDRVAASIVLAVVVLVPLLGFFVGPITLKVYDAGHRVHAVCTVTSAHSSAGSSHSLKGIGSSTAQIVFETSDCGTLVLQRGVTRDNEDDLAESIVPGERYEFDVGAASFAMRSFLNTIRQAVYVNSFELA
ncbi:hypothetical protein EDF51_10677 [Curtobacterium sp. PhB25]|uniref:hypothetical protein n=1 Tax=unclassified Curtobacterium TaxID=257496 RepID=UPI000FA4A1A0|nr:MULTISPECIES: hypothetical protein [unclassified Curtobacterium]ROS37617.1 hypothetical protein EDF53_1863 [Curtobacterium sp. PhB78]TCU87297.1 hypothetical protein EDF48_101138 [Curtobacterium sp. PhB191]TDW49265.1 hypothetical protein EDF52_10437 [Curtobacterium sp. PhB42]TDW56698.1 hypothetical protein EDF47_103286 [Curtobacterium sp. PhB190]TDW69094.1 hypothetical protein EDF51_10677 [Curtobacterium sp. PhB25]